jgi:hypothetical protein
VAKALGDGQRQIQRGEIYRLADALGAKRIVWGFAGHDRAEKLSIAIQTQEYSGKAREGAAWTGTLATHKFADIPMPKGTPAIEAYESVLPKMLKALAVEALPEPAARAVRTLPNSPLPPSPLGLVSAEENAARDAYAFHLYAALTPQYIERTKEVFVEKAHLALLRLPRTAPEYRALRARTFMAMGLRPAALKVLEQPRTDEERELLAVLSGNLPAVREMSHRERSPLKRLLQHLDEQTIATAYGVKNSRQSSDDVAKLQLPGTIWEFLVRRAVLDSDAWSQFGSPALKSLLDHELPIKGYSLEEITGEFISLGNAGKAEAAIDLSIYNHARKYLEANLELACCESASGRPGRQDYLELLEAIGHDNLIRRLRFYSKIQAAPEKAIRFANSIDAVYKDYPYYSASRAVVEFELAKNANGAEKAGLLKAAHEHSFNAMYWEHGQSRVSELAQAAFSSEGGQYYGPFDNFYYTDIPYRPYYWTWADGGNLQTQFENQAAALENATYEVQTAWQLLQAYIQFTPNDPRADKLLKSLENRFAGSPARSDMLGEESLRRGDVKAAERHFRENIKLAPGSWRTYMNLGTLVLKSGNPNEAAKVFRAYPGFAKGSSENKVGIANAAFDAGSLFFSSGEFALAEPFYRIAQSQRTGADSEMTSASRLKLLEGDIAGAMADSFNSAARYNDSYAYRDYLSLLYSTGRSKEAWAAFGALVRDTQKPQVWEAALVGHRVAGLTEAEVVEWARTNELSRTGMERNSGATYLVRSGTTDRTPSKALSEAIDALDQPRWKVRNISVLLPEDHPEVRNSTDKRRVRSIHAYFADAYRAIKLKEYGTANAIFKEAAKDYDFTQQYVRAAYSTYLPYYAYAAARAGDLAGIQALLSRFQTPQQDFDYQLAKAVLSAASGDIEESLRALKLARYRRPDTGFRPLLSQYTYAEIAVFLAEMTGDARLSQLALDWARQCQRSEPWAGWSYALEATLKKTPAERSRAVAVARYLDSRSERLARFEPAEIDAAVKSSGHLNPFVAKPSLKRKAAHI